MAKRLLLWAALVFAAACDDAAVLANIDTYTCAYLPGVVDCTTTEVHDRAVNVLEHGLVRANARCESGFACFPNNNAPPPYQCGYQEWNTALNVLMLQDGTLIQQFLPGTNSGTPLAFTPRGVPTAVEVQGFGCGLSVESTIAAGEWSLDLVGTPDVPCPSDYVAQPLTSVDIETECTGFNLEAFGELQ